MAIFVEGATRMMLDGAGRDSLFSCPKRFAFYRAWRVTIFTFLPGFGTSAKMYYDTTLQEARARGLKARPNDLPTTCKLTFMNGRYLLSEYNGTFYSKAQNLGRELSKAYDQAFEDYDVLLMPTIPKKAPTFPPANPSLEGK